MVVGPKQHYSGCSEPPDGSSGRANLKAMLSIGKPTLMQAAAEDRVRGPRGLYLLIGRHFLKTQSNLTSSIGHGLGVHREPI